MKPAAIATLLSFLVALGGAPATARTAHAHYAYRHVQSVALSDSQIAYALNHQQQMVAQLRNLHSIDIRRIRIVRLTARQKARFHVRNAASALTPQTVAFEPGLMQLDAGTQVAQVIRTNNPLINQIQQILTGILVQNALGGVLGGGNPNNNGGGYCGTDQYGNQVPCNNNGGGYCGTDQYGNPVPCNNNNNGNGYCGTDQYGNPVPCNNNGYGNTGSGNGMGTLANVLLSSGIPLSSLIGILFSGNGILNAIVG